MPKRVSLSAACAELKKFAAEWRGFPMRFKVSMGLYGVSLAVFLLEDVLHYIFHKPNPQLLGCGLGLFLAGWVNWRLPFWLDRLRLKDVECKHRLVDGTGRTVGYFECWRAGRFWSTRLRLRNLLALLRQRDVVPSQIQIDMLPPGHPGAQQAIGSVLMPSRAVLFGGDRLLCVAHVFVASIGSQFTGLATLAPSDEMGEDVPSIIALWVRPEYRGSEVGVALLRAAAAESMRQYDRPPRFMALTKDEAEAGRLAAADGIPIDFLDDTGRFNIPLP